MLTHERIGEWKELNTSLSCPRYHMSDSSNKPKPNYTNHGPPPSTKAPTQQIKSKQVSQNAEPITYSFIERPSSENHNRYLFKLTTNDIYMGELINDNNDLKPTRMFLLLFHFDSFFGLFPFYWNDLDGDFIRLMLALIVVTITALCIYLYIYIW